MRINTALKVAKHVLPAGDMIAKVAQSLHGERPRPTIIGYPPKIAVEHLVILNEWLDKDCLASPLWTRSLIGRPYARYVQFDSKVDNLELVEELDDLEGFVHGFDVEMSIVTFIHSTFFVPFVASISTYQR